MLEAIQDADFAVLDWIQAHLRGPVLDWLMPKITLLGDAGIFWIILALALLCIRKYRRWGANLSLGLVGCLLFGNLLLKNLAARSRPCWINTDIQMLISIPRDYSFPSGHTFSWFMGAVVLTHYHKGLGIGAFIVGTLVAFSRLYLYLHFPTDVLGGMVLGTVIGLGSIWAIGRLERRFFPKAEAEEKEKE